MRWPRWLAAAPAGQGLGPRFAVDRLRLFDTRQTQALEHLLALPRGRRDAAWTERFFASVWNASLVVADPAVITARDGFPYVRLNLPPAGRYKPSAVANLAALCLERATGVAVFTEASDPVEAAQFLFPVGMLDSLLRYDTWLGDPLDQAGAAPAAGAGSLEEGWGRAVLGDAARPVMLGAPSVHYLPTYTARALLNHMRGSWGIADPRVRLMVDPSRSPAQTLVLGRMLSDIGAAEWEVQRARLQWLLPKGRSLQPMPEDWRLEDMTPLEQLAGQVPGPATPRG